MKFTLVPASFFDGSSARECLSQVYNIEAGEKVEFKEIPQYEAVLIYSEDGSSIAPVLNILDNMSKCKDHYKIFASVTEGQVLIAVAQAEKLLFCNAFKAKDFTTAEYFIFSVLKSLQMNPEISTIHFLSALSEKEKMSLYRYFRSVEIS